MKIYVVRGETGEYEDYQSWSVSAFKQKEQAQQLVKRLNDEIKRIYPPTSVRMEYAMYKSLEQRLSKIDSRASVDYTGTLYSFYELEVLDEVPEVDLGEPLTEDDAVAYMNSDD